MNSPDPKTHLDQSNLPKLRTFAKDLEKKRIGKVGPQTQLKAAVISPTRSEPKIKTETPLYQKPKWEKVENVATQKKTVVDEPSKSASADVSYLHQAPASLTTQETDIVIENDEADIDGHIIRDTKKNRFNLFTAIGASINKWVQNFKRSQIEKRKPKYSVPDSTHRKGVIQRATSKTGKTASFDTQSIQERIRDRDAKIKPHTPETIWTPNTEPGFPLLEAEHKEPAEVGEAKTTAVNDLRPTNIMFEPRKSVQVDNSPVPSPQTSPFLTSAPDKPDEIIAPNAEKPVFGHDIPPAKPIEPNSRITTAFTFQNEITKPVTNPPEDRSEGKIPPTPGTAPDESEATPNTTPPATETPGVVSRSLPQTTKPKLAKPAQNRSFKKWLLIENTNRQSVVISVFLLIILTIGSIVFFVTNRQIETLELTPTYNFTNLIESPIQPISYTGQNRQELISLIRQNITQSGYPLQQLAITTDTRVLGSLSLLEPSAVMSILGLQPNPTQNLNLAEIYFGSTSQRPFIIMRSTNFNSALGGMLAWEESLYRQIIDILDLKGSENGEFRDVVLGNVDTRIYRDATDGTEIFVYGIVDRRYIIIAQNRVDFTHIANNVVKP
jgi:hypothetical protein